MRNKKYQLTILVMCFSLGWGGLFFSIMLSSCTDLDEVNQRIEKIEGEVNGHKTEESTPSLLLMGFQAIDNPFNLAEDVICTIDGDSVVSCWINHLMDDKNLIPYFNFAGDSVKIDGKTIESNLTSCDFKKPATLTVFAGNEHRDYTVYVHSFTGLPVVWIETEGRKNITSKDVYINAHFKLQEDVVTRSAGDIIEADVQIKGRGNSTWDAPKKPYGLKFEKKLSLLGEEKDKSWVLLANYFDMTMLRNQTAFYMGYISNLDYTPKAHFVEVMLNGKYHGTYQLCDKLKIAKHRVNVGDDGFLMEIDSRAIDEGAPYFKVEHIPQVVNIKDPDVTVGDVNYNYIKDYLTKADKVLFSDNFKDLQNGWQKYMDITSFVDYYIINEIAKNGDVCSFNTSCYLNLKRGGKLKMGPIWDNDNSFGKHENPEMYPVEGWYFRKTTWYSRLFEDPIFVNELKKRFAYFYNRKEDIMRDINNNAEYLRFAVEENNNRWNVLYNLDVRFNYNVWGSYLNEVQYLKKWLNDRLEWLNTEINNLSFI